MRTHKEIFTEIYDKNIWGGSGGGSDPGNTVEYRALLQKFLKDYNIKTVVDFGCGDWAFSKLIDWTGIEYIGIDCVQSVVESNRNKYPHRFVHGYTMTGYLGVDLLIMKDVLQHWSVDEINAHMSRVIASNNFKYILITNTASQEYDNQDIEAGQTRGLCARFQPLKKYNPTVIAEIQTTILSEVLLITNG